jgi:hypothetical protein
MGFNGGRDSPNPKFHTVTKRCFLRTYPHFWRVIAGGQLALKKFPWRFITVFTRARYWTFTSCWTQTPPSQLFPYEDDYLLGCCAMYSGISLPTFQRCMLRWVLIALMMEAGNTSETSVCFYQTTRRNNPKGGHFILAAVRTWNLN